MTGAPRVLFVPVSGPGGAGEYYRSLAIARAVERRWPGAAISFVMSREAPQAAGAPYPVHLVDRSPTYETAAVRRILADVRADVAVFDGAGRVAQYRCARTLGTRTVFVSSRPSTRRKGFGLRRLWNLDQHWIVAPRFLGGGLGTAERAKLLLAPRCEPVFLDVLYEPIDEEATRALQSRLGVVPGQYVIACPGGGGHATGGREPWQVYLEASRRVAAQRGLPVVAVLGPRATVAVEVPGVRVIESLPNAVLMGMVRDAECGVVNGGSLLVQAIAVGLPCVAAPISDDQPARVAACAAQGLVLAATLDADALAAAAQALGDASRRTDLVGRQAALGLVNGVDVAIAALERLLATPR